jgi:crotonobetainyl-CoA:carnitine CoA-transferase CaiB-like acyl-CoA transferase/enoyl-CoA hydratase/carnithine racemase
MTRSGETSAWPADPDAAGVLGGLKVLDLSRVVAGPYCAQMLADHGASVLKVEGPEGDDTRQWGRLSPDGASSGYYYGLNRNKRNVELDLATPVGQKVLSRLVEEADVLIENFKIGTMERWGLGYDDILARRRPGLVYCRVSGFGADGPMGGLPGYDAVLQAHGGLMSVNGYADRGSLRVGVPIVDIVAANLAFSGILLALRERDQSGVGQFVDITLLDSVVSLLLPHSLLWAMDGIPPRRTGSAHPAVAPYQVFDTPAGEFFLCAGNDRQFRSLMTILGRPELADDPRFITNAQRLARVEELAEIIGSLVAARDLDELERDLNTAGVPASPVKSIPAAMADPQVLHRQLFIDDGNYRGVGVPIKLSRSRPRRPNPPVPKGADNERVFTALGIPSASPHGGHPAGSRTTAPSALGGCVVPQTDEDSPILARVSDGIANLTLNNPGRKNAITRDMGRLIEEFCRRVEDDEAIGAVVIDAAGDYFCSGADTRDLGASSAAPASTEAMARTSAVYRAFVRVGSLPVPTVTVVVGGAVGAGLNLALASDLLLVTPDAVLDSGFLARSIHPGGGHFSLLGRSLTRQQALALGALGVVVSGEQAVRIGLAWKACPPETIRSEADDLVRLAASDPMLSRRIKNSAALELGPAAVPWAAAVELERGVQMWSLGRKGEAGWKRKPTEPSRAERFPAVDRERIANKEEP